jgi:branched-chain amino acid transport system substrate-binding protein
VTTLQLPLDGLLRKALGLSMRKISYFILLLNVLGLGAHAETKSPVLIGIDAEFGLLGSQSAQSIEIGSQAAVHEINAAGGVLGGRPLKIITKDNRSIPARGVENLKELVQLPDCVAVLGGRYSPVVLEQIPLIQSEHIPFIAVWSAADAIIENSKTKNYVFRVSLRDSLAMPFMLDQAAARGLKRVGILLTNTAWGRSNYADAEKYIQTHRDMKIVQSNWISTVDTTMIEKYHGLVKAGAQVVILVANDEAATLINEMAALPEKQRLPIISHWGITGGRFYQSTKSVLPNIDISVIQSFNFFKAPSEAQQKFLASVNATSGMARIEEITSPNAAAHAYDAVHLIGLALQNAGSADRQKIRDSLEKITSYQGLVKKYTPPFSPNQHEALSHKELLMTRFRADGVLVPQ